MTKSKTFLLSKFLLSLMTLFLVFICFSFSIKAADDFTISSDGTKATLNNDITITSQWSIPKDNSGIVAPQGIGQNGESITPASNWNNVNTLDLHGNTISVDFSQWSGSLDTTNLAGGLDNPVLRLFMSMSNLGKSYTGFKQDMPGISEIGNCPDANRVPAIIISTNFNIIDSIGNGSIGPVTKSAYIKVSQGETSKIDLPIPTGAIAVANAGNAVGVQATARSTPTVNIGQSGGNGVNISAYIEGQNLAGQALEVNGTATANIFNSTLTGSGATRVVGTYQGSGSSSAVASVSFTGCDLNYSSCDINNPGGTISTYAGDPGTANITINKGTNINGNSNPRSLAGIYANSKGTNITINTNGTIEGVSGVTLRGGKVTIPNGASPNIIGNGNPPTPINNDTFEYSDVAGNGDGICIMGDDADKPAYRGNAELIVKGNPTVTSINGSALGTLVNPASTDPAKIGVLNNLDIDGGTWNSAKGKPSVNIDEGITSSSYTAEDFISGGSFSDPIQASYLDGLNTVVVTPTENGDEYSYFKDLSQAQQYATTSGGTTYTINPNASGPAVPDTYVPPGQTTPPTNQYVYGFELGDNLLQFYNSSSAGVTANQSQNTGLTVSNYSTGFPASNFDWTVSSLNQNSNVTVPVFTNPKVWNGGEENGVKYYYQTSTDGHWQLKQYLNSNNSFGNTVLCYDGLSGITGVYQLTATTKEGSFNPTINKEGLTDSIRFTVSNTNVTSVTITDAPNSTTAMTSPYYVNLSSSRFLTPGYIARSGNSTTTGSVINWTLTPQNITGSTNNYYSFNQSTGQITFLKALPEGAYLQLNLSVDGCAARPIIVMTQGNVVPEDPESIEAYLDPLTLYSGGNYYNLEDNIIFKPIGVLTEPDDLVFTSTSNNVLIYNQTIIPSNTNFNGTVPITATYPLEDGTELTCTFDINFVSQQVNPTGIIAEDSLSFGYPDLTPQNVNARLTPDNTTQVYIQDDFTYTTSNSNVAVVDDLGNVTAVGEGTCTITTTLESSSGITLNTPAGQTPNNTAKTTVTVSSTPSDIPATGISVTPGQLNLTTKAGGTTQADVTVTLTPEDSTDEIVPVSSAPSVATVEAGTTPGTYTVKAVSDGVCQITFQAGSVTSNPVKVIVSSQNFVADSILALGIRPDEFTVSVSGIKPNPALTGISGNVQGVSIFTWTGPDQNDKQCKFVSTPNADGAYIYTPFTVNGNDVNTYYYNADNIYVQVYARVDGQDVYLGSAEGGNYSWINSATATATDTVAYITYQENIAFNRPTVFNGAASGVTGRHLQLEGLRVSSNIEGVKVVTEVHEQNIGWVEAKDDGVYAGTMHENRQLEAVKLRLVGDNASNYDIWYQAHVENIGWQAPVKNNEEAGTTGRNLQMESIKIQIVPKGETPTGFEPY